VGVRGCLLCPTAATWLGLCSGVLGKWNSLGGMRAMGTSCLVGASTRCAGRRLEQSVLCRAACLQLCLRRGEPPPFPAAAAFLRSPVKAAWAAEAAGRVPQQPGETDCVLPPLPQWKSALGWPGTGAGFGGRVGGWTAARTKAVQSGVETMRWVQSLPSSRSRTEFTCTPGEGGNLVGPVASPTDAAPGDGGGQARAWGAPSLLVLPLQTPALTIKSFPFPLMCY